MTDRAAPFLDHAPILHRSASSITFQVDDVQPTAERIELINIRFKLLDELTRSELLAISHEPSFEVVWRLGTAQHELVNAVHIAFSQHRPLLLTPDAIWLLLAQGFAQHINDHAEALRSRFVGHKDKLTLSVEVVDRTTTEHWAGVVQQWSAAITEHVGSRLHDLLICNFSTTTPVIRTASQVVMLDTFQQYFSYELKCICGIPSVTLRGTLADWIEIRNRVERMQAYHLEWWTDRVSVLCDEFVETAKGHPSHSFWRRIYKPRDIYGGHVITGWLADLFPYVVDGKTGTPTLRNPVLAIPREHLTAKDGVSSREVPTGLSQAPFTLTMVPAQQTRDLELVAGFIGVVQNQSTGHVEPEIGWCVRGKNG